MLQRFFLASAQPARAVHREGEVSAAKKLAQQESTYIFQGFDGDILAESFGVDTQDCKEDIVRVQKELQFLRPQRSEKG